MNEPENVSKMYFLHKQSYAIVRRECNEEI
jgi:hypothetical protein